MKSFRDPPLPLHTRAAIPDDVSFKHVVEELAAMDVNTCPDQDTMERLILLARRALEGDNSKDQVDTEKDSEEVFFLDPPWTDPK